MELHLCQVDEIEVENDEFSGMTQPWNIESDDFPMLSPCDLINILQDNDDKTKFICCLYDSKNKFNSKLELTRSEVERLEYPIIESVNHIFCRLVTALVEN